MESKLLIPPEKGVLDKSEKKTEKIPVSQVTEFIEKADEDKDYTAQFSPEAIQRISARRAELQEKLFAEAQTLASPNHKGETQKISHGEEARFAFKGTYVKRIPGFEETPQEHILEEREVATSEKLLGGRNKSRIVVLKDDGRGIFKAKKDECAFDEEGRLLRPNIEKGTYYLRERAAYLVSQYIGFDIVPSTVIREVDHETGSLQRFVDGRLGKDLRADTGERYTKRQIDGLFVMWLFDFVIWNSDRNQANYIEKDENIYAIDHGAAFGSELLQAGPGYFNQAIPESFRSAFFQKFASNPKAQENLLSLLRELLPQREVNAFRSRIEVLEEWMEIGMVPDKAKEAFRFKFNGRDIL